MLPYGIVGKRKNKLKKITSNLNQMQYAHDMLPILNVIHDYRINKLATGAVAFTRARIQFGGHKTML